MIVHPASRVVSAVRTLRRRLGVQRVFLASDAPPHDAELQQLLEEREARRAERMERREAMQADEVYDARQQRRRTRTR